MAIRVRRPGTLVLSGRCAAIGAWLLCVAVPALAAPDLTGEAGLGGRARAGRWMPVTVVLDSAASTSGQLTVDWGGAVARRALDLPGGARRSVTFMLRTGDPRGRVDVTFADATGTRTTAVLPVTVDADDTTVVACVDGGTDGACTLSVPSGQAPRDWRGWDAADEVQTPAPEALDVAQREAIARWAGRRQNESYFGSPVDPNALTPQVPARHVAPWLLLALGLPLAVSLAAPHRPRWRAPLQLGAIGLSVLGALGAGRTGTASTFRHVTVVHAFAGTAATLAETRGSLDIARDGRLRATLRSAGAWLESPGPGRMPQDIDGDGHPFVDLDARLGASHRLDAEYPGPPSPVLVTRSSDRVSIENRGSAPLRNCAFPASVDARGITAIDPSATVTLTGAVGPGDVMGCVWESPGPPLDVTGGARVDGASTLLVHLDTVLP